MLNFFVGIKFINYLRIIIEHQKMGAKEQISAGLRAYGKAFGVISQNGLGKYFIVPVILNVVFAVLLFWAGSSFGDWVAGKFDTGEGWIGAAGTTVRWIMKLLGIVLFVFIGGQIVTLCMSPIYTIISEKVDTAITGRTFETSASQTAKDIWRSIVITLKNTIKELTFTLLLLLLNFIPVVGSVLSTVLIFIVNSYYFGYSFMDYTNERERRGSGVSSNVVFHYKYLAFTIGAVYALLLLTCCGTFIAAFLGGVSTAAATIAQISLERQDTKISSFLQKV